MTLLMFSFRHTSLQTVHTDWHGHTAGYLCRSRPLQWCLIYVLVTAFWMSEIEPKRRLFKWDFTLGTKCNQQVLKLANTEGGRAQSHCSVTISYTIVWDTSGHCSYTLLIVKCLFSWMMRFTFCFNASVMTEGRPDLSASWTSVRPFLNIVHQFWTLAAFITCSP